MRGSKLTKIGYGLDDVGIKQMPICYTEHRGDINPYVEVCGRQMYPIFASPMESVVDEKNYKIFIENKITPVIPRSVMSKCTIEDRLKLAEETFVSFSEKEAYDIFEKGLFDLTDNTRYICIDMAHGTLNSLYTICRQIKDKYGDKVILMAGNVNNELAYNQLVFTTHSPYMLNYLTLAIKAGMLKEELKHSAKSKELLGKMDLIVPRSGIVRPKDVSIYEISHDGEIQLLGNYDGVPSDANFLNSALNDANEMFDALLEIQDEGRG